MPNSKKLLRDLRVKFSNFFCLFEAATENLVFLNTNSFSFYCFWLYAIVW